MAPTDEATDARLGTVVDKYRVTRLMGSGATGRVYEAEHIEFGQRVALKFMSPEHASNRERLRRFQNEAKAVGHLEHPNIVAVTDIGTAPDGAPYLVMEYLTGQDCGQLVAVNGHLPVARACDIVFQACLGLYAAHQAGIVHRDIKPENLFITQANDGTDLVKILDFAMATLRVPGASVTTVAAVAMGTVYYMAPEQVRDAGKVDGRADIWALGVVLYRLLTGRRPFDGIDTANIVYQISFEPPAPPGELQADIPSGLISAIDLALEKDPEKRFETVIALADAIAPFTGRPVHRPSNLANSQRPPLLTPVDAAYSIAHARGAAPSKVAASKSVMTMRQRAYRIYTLLLMAALVGFGGGGLTSRVVSSSRTPHVELPALIAVRADDVASPPVNQAPATEVGLPLANAAADASTNTELAVTAGAVPVASANTEQLTPRKVTNSVDAGAPRTAAAHSTTVPHPESVSSTKIPEVSAPKVSAPKVSAPKASAQAPEPTERVPDIQKSDEHAPSPSNTNNPL